MPNLPARRQQFPQRVYRPLVLTAALGLVAAPLTASAPHAAALTAPPSSPCFAAFTASSASDLVTLRQADLRPLGLTGAPAARALLGSARTGAYAGPAPVTGARAGQTDTGGPTNSVFQLAPPTSAAPATRTADPVVTDQVHAGVRAMTAMATLRNAEVCDEAGGPVARATFSLGSESSVAGRDEAMIAVPAGSATSTDAGLVRSGAGYAAQAKASTAVTDVRLLDAVTLRITGTPSLRVTATGTAATSEVAYTSGTVSATGPARPGAFQPVGAGLALVAPLNAAGAGQAAAVASSMAAQTLPERTLGTVLDALGAAAPAPAALAGQVLVIRVSPGGLARQNTGTVVHALATAVRIQVLVRSTRLDAPAETQLAEFAIGTVEALALAPAGGYPPVAGGAAMNRPAGGTGTAGTGQQAGGGDTAAGATDGASGRGVDPAAQDAASARSPAGDHVQAQASATGPASEPPTTRGGAGRPSGDAAGGRNGGGGGGIGGGGLDFPGDGHSPLGKSRLTLVLAGVVLLIGGVRVAGTADPPVPGATGRPAGVRERRPTGRRGRPPAGRRAGPARRGGGATAPPGRCLP